MFFFVEILKNGWALLLDSSIYVLFGLAVSGLLRGLINPQAVARHLGQGRFLPVFKAALLGIPLPLCSCGVLPAGASLKKQGASNGSVTAFVISTPETGADSLAVSYALLDPILTVLRPVAALFTAVAAGLGENLFRPSAHPETETADLRCPVDGCCDGRDCPTEEHGRHHGVGEKIGKGMAYAFREVWEDIAGWFFFGILLAGLITTLIPGDFLSRHLGHGLAPMLVMLAFSIPLYVCATASTPIAAALILKGVSPGAALVFLLAGPATNVASLTVLTGLLGKRAAAIYLGTIAVFSLGFGLLVDQLYAHWGLSPQATIGQGGELVPFWAQWAGALVLLGLSLKPLAGMAARRLNPRDEQSNRRTVDAPGSNFDPDPARACREAT